MRSQIDISGGLRDWLSALEQELERPLRVLNGQNTVVATNADQATRIDRDYGYFTATVNPRWDRPLNRRTDGNFVNQDYENGITLVLAGFPTIPRPRDLAELIIIPERGLVRRVFDRLRAARMTWLSPENGEAGEIGDPNFTEAEVETFTLADTNLVYAYAYPEVERMRGSVVIYPFMTNVLRSRDFDYDQLYRAPIEAAIGGGGSEEERRERYKQRFIEHAGGRIARRILETRRQVAVHEASAHDAATRYQEAIEALREEKVTLDTLVRIQAGEGGIDPEVEWERLAEHAMVKEVRVSNRRFEVYTEALEMTDPDTGERYPLGEFKITFPMQPGSGRGVMLRNLTNRKSPGEGLNPRDHPHVENERPCFGSLMTEVSRLAAAGEVGGMVETCLQYLQTFNPQDDFGRYAGLWGVSRDGYEEEEEGAHVWERTR